MPEANIEYLTRDSFQDGMLDPGNLRHYLNPRDGKIYITVYSGGDPKKRTSYRSICTNNSPEPLRAYSTLRRDEWKQLDEAVLEISRTRLGGVQDLIDNNLTYSLGDGLGTTVLEYHDMSDALTAELTMDGIPRAKSDRHAYNPVYLPIPIIHSHYEIGTRVLAASRKLGNSLDVDNASTAARKVNEKLEQLLFTSTTYAFGGGTIYSYLNQPSRNTVTLTVNWDASAKTGAQIVSEVISMKQTSIAAKHYGPWKLYIPTAYETVLDEDYDTTTAKGRTIRERLLGIAGISGIKVIDTLTANNVLLVQMTSDVVRLVQGMGVTNLEDKQEFDMVTKYKVMTIQVPQIRADQDGNSGIVHLAA